LLSAILLLLNQRVISGYVLDKALFVLGARLQFLLLARLDLPLEVGLHLALLLDDSLLDPGGLFAFLLSVFKHDLSPLRVHHAEAFICGHGRYHFFKVVQGFRFLLLHGLEHGHLGLGAFRGLDGLRLFLWRFGGFTEFFD
jgi:hypothetical protein